MTKISAYCRTLNCLDRGYPYIESIKSVLKFADEVIILDGGSTDGTIQSLASLCYSDRRVKFIGCPAVDQKNPIESDGGQKALAREFCTKDFCWQFDVDEIVSDKAAKAILLFVNDFPTESDIVSWPIVEYWGPNKFRVDVCPWKPRLSRNLPHITHGLPRVQTKTVEGKTISLGSDCCDYVEKESGDLINFSPLVSSKTIGLWNAARTSMHPDIIKSYVFELNKEIEKYGVIVHYSWFDIAKKIKSYKDYWAYHWRAIYGLDTEDTAENNVMFNKPWSEVSDEDIKCLATKLEKEKGGWFFHNPVDWAAKTCWIDKEDLNEID